MYTGFCILSILWKHKEENIVVHVYQVLYSQFSLETETENTEPNIHVHLCFLLSVSREYWEYRTLYTCTSMFSSFCFERILRIQNPVYEAKWRKHRCTCILGSVFLVFSGNKKKNWEYRTQYTCTSMFSSLNSDSASSVNRRQLHHTNFVFINAKLISLMNFSHV
jgi:hypothetical protein